jgi:hypothetical protein
MAKKNRITPGAVTDCACVIHSTGYDWRYVENLYSMLTRALPGGIRFHVYTEHDRSVPPHMIKHILTEWPGIEGPKKSWWYKMQMFNPEHYSGNLLYLDLDTVVVRDLSWISNLDTRYFWAIRDFRYLQNPHHTGFNSSVMWWNVSYFSWIWEQFSQSNIKQVTKNNPGDQDYITKVIDINQRRFFEDRMFESFRWQCLDGGYNFQRRQHKSPGSGVTIAPDTSVVIFHGSPKPHQISDTTITQLWR